jgi:hypothetical protein
MNRYEATTFSQHALRKCIGIVADVIEREEAKIWREVIKGTIFGLNNKSVEFELGSGRRYTMRMVRAKEIIKAFFSSPWWKQTASWALNSSTGSPSSAVSALFFGFMIDDLRAVS